MNKRIQELTDASHNSYLSNTGEWYREFDYEKFAYLLIQECLKVIQSKSMNSGDEWEDGLQVAKNAILEHFEIQE